MSAYEKLKSGIAALRATNPTVYNEMADLLDELNDGFDGSDEKLVSKFDANVGALSAEANAAYLAIMRAAA